MDENDTRTAQLIEEAKSRLRLGPFNVFLLWGYLVALVSLAEYALVSLTHSGLSLWGWFLIPLIGYPLQWRYGPQPDTAVANYPERLVRHVWFFLKVAFLLAVAFVSLSRLPWMYLLPLTLLMSSIGVSVTGAILRERPLMVCPVVALCIGLYQLTAVSHGDLSLAGFLQFSLAFLIMLVLPGHLFGRSR